MNDVVMLSYPGQSDAEALAVFQEISAQVAARPKSTYAALGAALRIHDSAAVGDHFEIAAPNLLAFAPDRSPAVVVPIPGGRTDLLSLRRGVYV